MHGFSRSDGTAGSQGHDANGFLEVNTGLELNSEPPKIAPRASEPPLYSGFPALIPRYLRSDPEPQLLAPSRAAISPLCCIVIFARTYNLNFSSLPANPKPGALYALTPSKSRELS